LSGDRPIEALPSALARREEIARRLRGRRMAVFLDYDGTLTPIVSRPELATLPGTMRRLLEQLAGLAPVAIVTGRDLREITGLVALPAVIYAGSHGFEIAGPGGLTLEKEEGVRCLPDLDAAEAALRSAVGPIPGSLVERKRFSVAVHYRNVAEPGRDLVGAIVTGILGAHPGLRRAAGKMVIELRPDFDWDKGRAVEWILGAIAPAGDALPVYVGDDLTDEDAFVALSGRGLTVVVAGGGHRTRADYALRDTGEVERFLEMLIDAGRGGPDRTIST